MPRISAVRRALAFLPVVPPMVQICSPMNTIVEDCPPSRLKASWQPFSSIFSARKDTGPPLLPVWRPSSIMTK